MDFNATVYSDAQPITVSFKQYAGITDFDTLFVVTGLKERIALVDRGDGEWEFLSKQMSLPIDLREQLSDAINKHLSSQ